MALKEKGKIVEWNTSRSFGFIRSQFNSNGIFIHISDFKDKQYKPKIGDIIDYEVGTGKDNKKKAIKAIQEGKFSSIHTYKKTSRKERKLYILLILLPFFLFLFFLSKEENKINKTNIDNITDNTHNYKLVTKHDTKKKIEKEINSDKDMLLIPKGISNLYNKDVKKPDMPVVNHNYILEMSKKISREKEKVAEEVENNNKYKCNGRQHCSQMRSCEEATFFIRNCPNTKMDGDGDGIPCERQWCSY